MTNTTRAYKDTVFSSLFYDCKDAIENAKSLYKAITGKTVQHAEKCRLEDVLFREFKNDVAYIMDGKFICFIEHQSSINQNMPLRCLIYAARTYDRKTIYDERLMYSTQLIKIPTPEFYVLYNGQNKLEYTELQLSDSFKEDACSPNLELKVKVININLNNLKNTKLKDCKELYGYACLIEKIREYKGDIKRAVNECVEENILRDYLTFYGSEVVNMLFTEYDAEQAKKVLAEESRAEGEAIGRAEGKAIGRAEAQSSMLKKLQKLGNSVKQLSAMFDIPENEIEKLLAMK